MNSNEIFSAGTLENGQTCPCCQHTIRNGEQVARCTACGSLQHADCWRTAGECRSYHCIGSSMPPEERSPAISITRQDVAQAKPLPASAWSPPQVPHYARKYSKLAIAAFILALAGIMLIGLPALIAVVLGAIAVGSINSNKRLKGMGFAISAVIIGSVAIIAWTAFGAFYFSRRAQQFEYESPFSDLTRPPEQSVSPETLQEMSEPIRRAIIANVLVTSSHAIGWSQGSGVIIERRGSELFIITNRHVVGNAKKVDITFFDNKKVQGDVIWTAHEGIDAAVISCTLEGDAGSVPIRTAVYPRIGESVFAVGNPLGLGWTYSTGTVSALRTHKHLSGTLKMIQTQMPLNPGNSGGGLYDESGALIAINTLSTSRMGAGGIGFAISIVDLVPFLRQVVGLAIAESGAPQTTEQSIDER